MQSCGCFLWAKCIRCYRMVDMWNCWQVCKTSGKQSAYYAEYVPPLVCNAASWERIWYSLYTENSLSLLNHAIKSEYNCRNLYYLNLTFSAILISRNSINGIKIGIKSTYHDKKAVLTQRTAFLQGEYSQNVSACPEVQINYAIIIVDVSNKIVYIGNFFHILAFHIVAQLFNSLILPLNLLITAFSSLKQDLYT